MRRRRRTLTILFLPIIAAIFMVGWLLYIVGDQRENNKKTLKKLTVNGRTDEDGVKMGILEELTERQLVQE